MSESTQSSTSQNRPLTAAERQDLYNSAIGSINNTYRQSGFPYDGSGSMNYMALFDGNSQTSGRSANPGDLYLAGGNASASGTNHGFVTLDPKTYFQAENPDIRMPTGARDPGGINFPTYVAPAYQNPGNYRTFGDYTSTAFVDPGDASQAVFVDPGQAKQMAGGDYARLEQNIANSIIAVYQTAPAADSW